MSLSRRAVLGAASAAVLSRRSRAADRPLIKIGVINDQSGVYRDVNGPTSVACTRQAIQEFGAGGFDIEVLVADHQNKPDLAASITKQWIDQEGVDFIQDGASSAAALAISSICAEKNKVFVPTSTATSDLHPQHHSLGLRHVYGGAFNWWRDGQGRWRHLVFHHA
jgi:branched-chain amino acid transport system substrate-binding protein